MKNGSLCLEVSHFWSVLVHLRRREGLERFLSCTAELRALHHAFCWSFRDNGGIMVDGRLAGAHRRQITLILLVGTTWRAGSVRQGCDAAHPSFDPHQCMAPACSHHGFPDFPRGEYGRGVLRLGDPPLTTPGLFQRGVPFAWTFQLTPTLLVNMVIPFLPFLPDGSPLLKDLAAGRMPEESRWQRSDADPVGSAISFTSASSSSATSIANGFLQIMCTILQGWSRGSGL